MASTYLTRTLVNSNQKKFTISVWLKRSKLGAQQSILGVGGSAAYATHLYFDGSDRIDFWNYFNSAYQGRKVTNRVFKDTNAWYHIVAAVDTTSAQSTADDRMKIYVNGVRETSFSTSSNPNQDQTFEFSSASVHQIGRNSGGDEFDGCMSHFHFVDGSQLEPTVFGETDATTGEWKIKTSPSYTAGTNGFWVLKDGNSVTDSSTNSNDFTVAAGTLTKTEDNPSNVFAAFNPLVPKHANLTLSNGNTTLSSTNSQWLGSMTTIPLYGGKWYYECKYNTGHNIKLSIVGQKKKYQHFATANQSYGEYNDNGYGYQFNNSGADYLGNNDSTPNWGGGLSSNSGNKIYMVAINLENGKIWYGADGTWFDDASGNTGNPATDAHPHQTISATHLAQVPFIVTGSVEGNGATMNWNFGNGYFGTTAVASAGTNASGIGIFEYNVPSGFTAISTKGLNE